MRLPWRQKRLENSGHRGEYPLYTLVVHSSNCESFAKQVPIVDFLRLTFRVLHKLFGEHKAKSPAEGRPEAGTRVAKWLPSSCPTATSSTSVTPSSTAS